MVKLYAPSASMTVTLSKDFEILSKEPNFSSKEEYVKVFYTFVFLLGALNWCVVGMASCFVMLVLASISIIHKKMSMKK